MFNHKLLVSPSSNIYIYYMSVRPSHYRGSSAYSVFIGWLDWVVGPYHFFEVISLEDWTYRGKILSVEGSQGKSQRSQGPKGQVGLHFISQEHFILAFSNLTGWCVTG